MFIFSRAGCDAAVAQCTRSGLQLNGPEEVAEVRRIIAERTSDLPEGDLGVLGYWEWREGLERGIAGHHAGLLPAFKETVEELFVRGLVKVVFATETLALGINMPARTVVLERLVKYNGEAHVDLTPGEYTQLTGRAGRRGIDVEGHAVVLWQPGVDPKQVAGLASTRTYPLRSSFRPGYNMAINLVAQLGREKARDLLEQSFAQFQADRSVVGTSRRIERNTEALREYAGAITGDFDEMLEYVALRKKISEREKALSRQNTAARRANTADSLEKLRKGRRDRGSRRAPRRARRDHRSRRRPHPRAEAHRGHRGPLVRSAVGGRFPVTGGTARPDPAAQTRRTAVTEDAPRYRLVAAQRRDFLAVTGKAAIRVQ